MVAPLVFNTQTMNSLPVRVTGSPPAVCADGPQAADEALFRELADRWKSETKFLSNVTKKAIHPAYQRIIGMGQRAVPLILEELAEKGPDDWFWALTAITGANPISEEMAGNMAAMTEAWLRWGTEAGYLSGSHRKTKAGSRTSGRTTTG